MQHRTCGSRPALSSPTVAAPATAGMGSLPAWLTSRGWTCEHNTPEYLHTLKPAFLLPATTSRLPYDVKNYCIHTIITVGVIVLLTLFDLHGITCESVVNMLSKTVREGRET